MGKYIASSDIYIDTFYTDKPGGGIGVAVMEAMSCGLPIIAASRPGIEAGVTEGVNGYFFKGDSPEDLAEKILLLSKNPKLRREFGLKSRVKAVEIGDWKRNMLAVEKKYRELASR
jgi:glycosyltransferase involved in cell wall biosynthesis